MPSIADMIDLPTSVEEHRHYSIAHGGHSTYAIKGQKDRTLATCADESMANLIASLLNSSVSEKLCGTEA